MGHVLSKRQPYQQQSAPSSGKQESGHTPSKPDVRTPAAGSNGLAKDQHQTRPAEMLKAIGDEHARDLLRETWKTDFGDLYEVGTEIYAEIFRLQPSVKQFFPELNAYDLIDNAEALRECKAFGKQALRFVQTLSMAVRNCGHLQDIDDYLKDIGRRHVQYQTRGFEPQHWRVFETAISNVMAARSASDAHLDADDRRTLAESWKQLSRHIVATMTVGFELEH